MPRKFWAALLEGTIWSLIGVAIFAGIAGLGGGFGEFEPDEKPGLFNTDFARRWDGTCHGWTRPEAIKHLAGNIAHWWAYCTIAFVFWRLHPPLRTVPYSVVTLTLVGWFIMGCGMGHLIACFTMFYPMYRLEGYWLIFNGIVSITATIFVAFTLTTAFEFITARRLEVEIMKEEFQRLKNESVNGR